MFLLQGESGVCACVYLRVCVNMCVDAVAAQVKADSGKLRCSFILSLNKVDICLL